MDHEQQQRLQRAYEAVSGPLVDSPHTAHLIVSVDQAVERARAQHPAIKGDEAGFVGRIAHIAGAEASARETIDELFAGDLWLAHHALAGNQTALITLDEILQRALPGVLQRRIGRDDSFIEEVMQIVRVRVLVGGAARSPKLRSYKANGPLTAWLRVVAVRIAYDEPRAPDATELESALLQATVASHDDPEVRVLLTHQAPVLRLAMESAVRRLPQKELYLLRMSLVEALSIDEIGAIYNCHRATAARWVSQAKDLLGEYARQAFCELTQATQSEFHSLIRGLPAYFDVSLERLLSEPAEQSWDS